jgi:diketogulonate reductase-like aldo/keto reductase
MKSVVILFVFFNILLFALYFSFPVGSPPTHPTGGVRVKSNLRTNSLAADSSTRMKYGSISAARAAVPDIIYGTAWKKERTQGLVEEAIKQGFRAVDTACQPKHYHEKGIGDALHELYSQNIIQREDIFLQTKFTSVNGQDPKSIPYDRNLDLREQILQSFEVSLNNLRTNYLDSLVMHSPMGNIQDTLKAWRTFEEIHKQGKVRFLGLSNTYQLSLLQSVYESAEIKPSFLQNRFYRESGYDEEIRAYCLRNNIRYQSFWTLTANPDIIHR